MAYKGDGIDGFKYLVYVVTKARISIDTKTWACQHIQWNRLHRDRRIICRIAIPAYKKSRRPLSGSWIHRLKVGDYGRSGSLLRSLALGMRIRTHGRLNQECYLRCDATSARAHPQTVRVVIRL